MLTINDITYRLGERLLLDHTGAAIPDGARVGFVGRNGTGKTTLFKIITGELGTEGGTISLPRGRRIGGVAQEAPGGPETLIEVVLAADAERTALMKEAETATDPHRIAEIGTRLVDIGAHAAPARAAMVLHGLGFDEAAQQRPCSDFSGGWRMRVALAAVLFSEPDLLLLDEPTNYHALALRLPRALSAYRAGDQPRPRTARRLRRPHPASRPGEADALSRRLFLLREAARRKADAAHPRPGEAGGRA
jgi:ATP-binding cassette subfamily F protein 3